MAQQQQQQQQGILILSDEQVKQCVDWEEAIEVNTKALMGEGTHGTLALSSPSDNLVTLFKGGLSEWKGNQMSGMKIVGVRPNNAQVGLPTVPAVYILMDQVTALPLSFMNASALTAIRTAAGSAVATKFMSRANSHRLVVIGAGLQGHAHIHAMRAVRPIQHITIWNRSVERARHLADKVMAEIKEEHAKLQGSQATTVTVEIAETSEQLSLAIKQSDIIVTATNTNTPLFHGKDLPEGVHINAIGSYLPDMQELDEETVRRGKTITDHAPQEILKKCGDYLIPLKKGIITSDSIVGDISQQLQNKVNARTSNNDITIFKSVGHPLQDTLTAYVVYLNAKSKNIGQFVNL